MTNPEAIIAKVLELDGKATKGPWMRTGGYVFTANERGPVSSITYGYDSEMTEADADLIAYYRTAAPELAKRLRVTREEISNAPHGPSCATHIGIFRERAVCDCWKQRTLSTIDAPVSPWRDIASAPRDGTEILGWHPEWLSAEFSPSGIRSCIHDGERWCSAHWVDDDSNILLMGNHIQPLKWQPLPQPPVSQPTP